MNPKIIFEDKEILVINKPSRIVVNRAETVKKGESLQDWVEKRYEIRDKRYEKDKKEEFIRRSGVVHRLDKETSGVMVLAKTPAAFQNLKNQFKRRKTEKEYIALVHGKVTPKKGNINLPLARNPKNRRRFTVKVGGREALTFYEVDKYLSRNFRKDSPLYEENEIFSLVKVRPRTGRTHQIRVHFSFTGHRIVSDPLYLSRKRLESDLIWCPRLFLHAKSLSFLHPKTGGRRQFKVGLPGELRDVIEKF